MTEAMKIVKIADSIANLFQKSKETCRAKLIACNKSLEEVDIGRGIFQGDSFSPLLFLVVLIPLLIILNKKDLRYVTSQNQKLNYLFFIDDLMLCARSDSKLDSFIQTMGIFSDDSGMIFSLEKCAVLVLEGERWFEQRKLNCQTESI